MPRVTGQGHLPPAAMTTARCGAADGAAGRFPDTSRPPAYLNS